MMKKFQLLSLLAITALTFYACSTAEKPEPLDMATS